MTKSKKPLTDLDRARRALPMCACCLYDPYQHKTVADLAFTVETEIDLTEEGQDGTSRRNLKPLRNWLRKFAPDSKYIPKAAAPPAAGKAWIDGGPRPKNMRRIG
jgi:hypothetical protein